MTQGSNTSFVGATSTKVIKSLYQYLDQNPDLEFLKEWSLYWSSIHGRINLKKKVNSTDLAEKYNIRIADFDLPNLVFSIETYFVFLVRLLSHLSITSNQVTIKSRAHSGISLQNSQELLNLTTDIFLSQHFMQFGIQNFNGGEIYSWFADTFNQSNLEVLLDDIESIISIYNAIYIGGFQPDIIRKIQEELLPKQLRHSLGAYYTPDWIADYILEKSGYVEKLKKNNPSLIDPHLGCGTFILRSVFYRAKTAPNSFNNSQELFRLIEQSYLGFDIDPVAINASKAGFILQAIDQGFSLIKGEHRIEIPFYISDSIFNPSSETHYQRDLFSQSGSSHIRIGPKIFCVPTSILSNDIWERLCGLFEAHSVDAFEYKDVSDFEGIESFFEELNILNSDVGNINEIWQWLSSSSDSRLFLFKLTLLREAPKSKNAKQFDFVLGNPPWVNWEYIPSEYRSVIKPLWPVYGLLDSTGKNLTTSKEDLSSLATYVAVDKFLANRGVLGFLLPLSLYKSAKNSRGFRRFHIGPNGPDIKVLSIDDMSEVSTFLGASNNPSIGFFIKGERTTYPLPYRLWKYSNNASSASQATCWADAKLLFKQIKQEASPQSLSLPGSSWITGPPGFHTLVAKIDGKSAYKARTGVFTGGANAVYYVDVINRLSNGNFIIRNVIKNARRKVEEIEWEIEPTFLYPFIRGRQVDRWHVEIDPNLMIICPHTKETGMRPVSPSELQKLAPKTMAYFERFSDALNERRGFASFDQPSKDIGYYTLLRIGPYTFTPYKVVWRYISNTFKSCVLEPFSAENQEQRPILPQEKLMLIGVDEPEEAYYICGMLSSTPIVTRIENSMIGTQISASLIEPINLPFYDDSNPTHVELSRVCEQGHKKPELGTAQGESSLKTSIDQLAGEVLGLSVSDIAKFYM